MPAALFNSDPGFRRYLLGEVLPAGGVAGRFISDGAVGRVGAAPVVIP